MNPQNPLIGVASAGSGSGKTLVSLGLMEYFNDREVSVQPFKVGPDYIDSLFHSRITDRPSPALDLFFTENDELTDIVTQYMDSAGIGIIEGVMGLFDGIEDRPFHGSTAEIFRTLDVPYILVVDAGARSHSVVAEIEGFIDFDPQLQCLGLVLNRLGSDRHERMIRRAINRRLELPVLASIQSDSSLEFPSRHLGLDSDEALGERMEWRNALNEHVTPKFDGIEKYVSTQSTQDSNKITDPFGSTASSDSPVIGVAFDRAFHFYYDRNLRRLSEFGARLRSVSPLTDSKIPRNLDGLYFGGGYPETVAAELSQNTKFMNSLRERLESGLPVLAECGGLLYLVDSLIDRAGQSHSMLGWFSAKAIMDDSLNALGYVAGETTEPTPIGPSGTPIRGHEFHYSIIEQTDGISTAYELDRGAGLGSARDGLHKENVVASYAHLYWPEASKIPRYFVENCKLSAPVEIKFE